MSPPSPSPAPGTGAATSSFLLGNLHCPSCVAAIRSLLEETYGRRVLWVSPNLVTSIVTVEHYSDEVATVGNIEKTLEDVGFEVCGVNTTARSSLSGATQVDPGESSQGGSLPNGPFEAWSRLWRSKESSLPSQVAQHSHLQHCKACQDSPSAQSKWAQDDGKTPLPSALENPAGSGRLDGLALAGSDTGSAQFKATVSIGGMTCASCVNAITAELKELPWISDVAVNLLSNSATVEYSDRDKTDDIVEAIEDLGYEAVIDQVINLTEWKRQSVGWRQVIVQIDGIFCGRCPDRIGRTLKGFRPSQIEILQQPSLTHPYLSLRYIPDAPSFTIRHILRAIEATDASFSASIYNPPTLEEKSRVIRARHQRRLLHRELMTLVVAIPTFVLGIVYQDLVSKSNLTREFLTAPWKSGLSRNDVILCLLATPVYFFADDIFHRRAWSEMRTMWRRDSRTAFLVRFYKFGSMNMLMSLGTTIAYVSSVAQMIAAGATGGRHISSSSFYFDSVVFLTLFLLAGRIIEAYSKSKTGDAVEALAKLRPTTALLVEKDKLNGQTTSTVAIDQLDPGDIIRVPHGASPAADGIVLNGETSFDESSLTGESRLIKKTEGDEVFTGTVNKGSAVTMRITGTSGRSMLDQIVDAVREGQAKRAPMEQVADVLTTYFVPVVTLAAIITWVVWMVLVFSGAVPEASPYASQRVAFAFQFAIAVFVVACPCGLGLAAPTAIFVGGSLAAKHGILAKGGGHAFQKASKVDCVVFDKTGTLTVGGEPQITDAEILPDGDVGLSRSALLSALKAVEENSSHPIAKAIVDFCGPDVKPVEVGQVKELAGRGMTATATVAEESHEIAVGNEKLLESLSVRLPDHVALLLGTWKAEAKSVSLVAVKAAGRDGWKLGAALSISDPIRAEAVAVTKALQSRNIQVWMLSGDNVTTAEAVARRVGIPPSNVLAEVLPSEKAAKISYLQSTLHASAGRGKENTSRRAQVAMVGDGINDSPALTAADVGIAIGSGSDVAISSADFVLALSSLTSVLTLLDLSRVVFNRIKLNFGWALVYNLAAVPIAAGCLYAVRTDAGEHVRLDPVWASLAMALSSISVVVSSLALRTKIPFLGFRPKLLNGM